LSFFLRVSFFVPGANAYTPLGFFFSEPLQTCTFPGGAGVFFDPGFFFDPGQGVVNFLGGRTYVYDCKIDPNQVAKSHLSAFIRLIMHVFPLFQVVFVFLSPRFFLCRGSQLGFFFSEGLSKRALFPSGAGFFFDGSEKFES
jgi:hypothetical protein